MVVLIISIIAAWIIFSALLVTIICVNSSRLSRLDEPFKDPARIAKEIEEYDYGKANRASKRSS